MQVQFQYCSILYHLQYPFVMKYIYLDFKLLIILIKKHIMRNKISSMASFKLQFAFAVLMMLFSGNLLIAQNGHSHEQWQAEAKISYLTPFSYTMKDNVYWDLKNEQNNVIRSGNGSLSDYTFDEPGKYTLNIKKSANVESNIPDKLNIKVSPMKMVFDMSSVTISPSITGGHSTDGSTLTVNVDFKSYDGKSVVYNKGFISSGIDTNITGKLKNSPVTLNQGKNVLVFKLQGQALSGNYISFHFKDINDEIQSYDLTNQIP